ncbi:hypothetical protein [Haloplanus halophilus]|uniref:hypothetical protein n=1 Tax=Haloplanus halophilus TaxID=2949993 RepID=UPI00203FF947|nr:hypothetical protein [Haloplanus sp. GDY1]
MNSTLLELLPQLVELLAFALGSVGLSVAGLYIERFALTTVESGQVKLGAWLAFMGAMAFYFAYLMGTDKFRPKLAAVQRRLAE